MITNLLGSSSHSHQFTTAPRIAHSHSALPPPSPPPPPLPRRRHDGGHRHHPRGHRDQVLPAADAQRHHLQGHRDQVLPAADAHRQRQRRVPRQSPPAPRRPPLGRRADGFASLWTGRALARGFCFGDPAPEPCLRCLSDAGRKIIDQCGDAGRRAGFLNDGCFLGYADTNASSSAGADDDIGAVTFSGYAVPRLDDANVQKLVAVAQSLVPRSANGQLPAANATATASNGDTVRVLAQCATECARCLRDSALQIAKSWGATAGAVQGSVAAVLGSNCYLRFEISAPPLPLGEQIRRMVKENEALTVCIAIIFVLVVAVMALAACVYGMRMGIQAWNAAAAAAAAAAQGN